MKNLVTFFVCMFFVFSTFAQKNLIGTERLSSNSEALSCDPITTDCNFFRNITFNPVHTLTSTEAGDPFTINLIPEWNSEWGSPNIYDGINFTTNTILPPFSGAGEAWMLASNNFYGPPVSEGISQKIPSTIRRHTYTLSFYKCTGDIYNVPGATHLPIDEFNIYLTDCAFHNTEDPYHPYEDPAHSQKIYCETNIVYLPGNWEHIFVTFTANGAYNFVWAIPKITTAYAPGTERSGIFFSYPEMSDLTALGNTSLTPDGDCRVSLPSCGPNNSILTWTGPSGQTIVTTPNTPVFVDASDGLNIGYWTLSIQVPDEIITNNSCSSDGNANASYRINVPRCTGSWPKAYATKPSQLLLKTDNGLLIMDNEALPAVPYMNHIGAYASLGTATTLEYDSHGVTSWYSNPEPFFALHNGDIQMNDYNYYNSVTNALSTGPSIVPAGERIIAQTHGGDYITSSELSPICYGCGYTPFYSGQIYIHSSSLGTSVPIAVNNYAKTIFNPASNKLFVFTNNLLDVYTISGITYTHTQTSFTGIPVQVTTADRVYLIQSSQLVELDYSTIIGSYSPVSATGFVNSNLGSNYADGMCSDNPYTEDRVMVMNTGNNYIYSVDLSNMSSKKIAVSSTSSSVDSRYVYDGDDVYISLTADPAYTIGTQIVPVIGGGPTLLIFTKLNLNSDFSFRADTEPVTAKNTAGFFLNIYPNPANEGVSIDIKKENNERSSYTVAFKDKFSNTVLIKKNYVSGEMINISDWRKGFYSVEVLDNKGAIQITKFIKL